MVELRGVEGYQFSRVLEGCGVEYALSETRFLHDLIKNIRSPKSKRGGEIISHLPLRVMSMSCILKPTFRSCLIKLHV